VTFLQLVNMALRESGADLDSLSDFSTMNSLQTKMKNWVSQAWREICMERDEWHYMTGQAVVDVYPRIYVEDWNRAGGIPAAGATFSGVETEWGFTLVSVDSVEGLITNANGLSAFISIEEFIDQAQWPLLNEQFEELAPTPDSTAFIFKGWGRYQFQNYTDTVNISGVNTVFSAIEPQITTFYVQDVENEDPALYPITFVPYPRFVELCPDYPSTTLGKPEAITITPDGRYDFWPRLDKHYVVKYNYTKAVNELSSTTDVPLNLSSEYHEIIVWKALEYYAFFDKNQELLQHAHRRYSFFRNRMERREMPVVTFGRNRFNYRS
jgi:hypothetical protein